MAKKSKFLRLYNQFSSVYGRMEYINYGFIDSTPVLIESSYNIYNLLDILFKICRFEQTSYYNYLVNLLGLEETCNSRPELDIKSLPNIFIMGCGVVLPDNVKQ